MNSERLQAALMDLVREKNLAVEKLSREQMAEAIRQACACGDFQRLVTVDERQQVIYLPFAREQELLSRIKELETEIAGYAQ